MIQKILIANRSEIAARVIRTARDMGVGSVAVYADQDLTSRYTDLADEAYALEGETHAETYLNGDKLIAIAKEAGADAIHPGYGFLSEIPAFARAVAEAGLTWIGPTAESIEAVGDKISARRTAETHGVQPVPGLSDPVETREQVEEFLATYGYPAVLKRADGGGGRGISVLNSEADLATFMPAHEHELDQYFIEKYVRSARHVETQCARDSHGNFHVVTTRDCSVQRRHQKLIEEAPAPFVSEESDQALRDASRRIFEGVNYVGLGTCEFLLDEDGSVYFLEVNPRLQVEHTVSEEVSGIDLVREQIRIANGEELTPVTEARGHSFEFRITSEDPANRLLPTAGVATTVRWPEGLGIRLESGLMPGDTVTPDFDSMLAKLVVTGPDRAQAIARSRRALAEVEIEGVATPVSIFQDVLDRAEFTAEDGEFGVTTRWFEDEYLSDDGAAAPAPAASTGTEPAEPEERHSFIVEIDGKRSKLTLPATLLSAMGGAVAAPAKGAKPRATQRQPLRGSSNRSGTSRGHEAIDSNGLVSSPIQAIVVRVVVKPGQPVAEGDLLVVLESMKMESYVHAPVAGTVDDVSVSDGANVNPGSPLLRLITGSAGPGASNYPAPADTEENK